MTDGPELNDDPESSLRTSWSIGPLRPWLLRVAQQEIPRDMHGKIDPSDVVQEALLDAWRAESGFHGTSHGQRLAWLRMILRRVVLQKNRARNAQKRGGNREIAAVDALAQTSARIDDLAVGNEPKPDEAIEQAEMTLLVAAAINKLPIDYRRVVELRHLQQKSHASIARELDRTPEAARMLWVRALVELRSVIRTMESG